MVSRSGFLVVFVAMVSGCGNTDHRTQRVPESQRRLALGAVDKLRERINRNCEDTLNIAVQGLRSGQHQREWVDVCRSIRETWGEWNSFDAGNWNGKLDIIEVVGPAAFAKGKCDVWLVWDLRPPSPRMMRFKLLAPNNSIEFPPSPIRHSDPLTRRDRQNS